MRGRCDPPSLVAVKYKVRSYLLVKDIESMGEKYNVEENKLSDNSLAHGTKSNVKQDDKDLQQELCFTSVIFNTCLDDKVTKL